MAESTMQLPQPTVALLQLLNGLGLVLFCSLRNHGTMQSADRDDATVHLSTRDSPME